MKKAVSAARHGLEELPVEMLLDQCTKMNSFEFSSAQNKSW
jgi:hypothetical protein